jgi:hypothetical protein
MPITRNRVIYAGTDVLVSDSPSWSGQTGVTSLKLLKRIQSSSISINNSVTRAKQIGSSDFAFEKYIQTPTIEVGLDYLCSDNSNELLLGLNATGNEGFLKNLASSQKDKNLFFVLTDSNAQDADSLTNMIGNDVFAIGNSFLTNYSLNAEVGSVATASVSFSCLNMTFQNYSGAGANGSEVPSITLTNGIKSTEKYMITGASLVPSNYLTNQNIRANALRPGDIQLLMPQPIMGGVRYSGLVPASITSLKIDVPIERRDLLGFGSNYPYDKRIMFPLIGKLSFNGTFDEPVTGDFSNIFADENNYDFAFNLKNLDSSTGLRIDVYDARVESQGFNLSIGDNLTFQSEFSFKIFENDGMRLSGQAAFYDTDAYKFLEITQTTDTATRTGINNFVTTLKNNGLWYKMSGIYPFIGGTPYTNQFNLKDPRDLDSAFRLVFEGEGTIFSSNSGVNFAGTDDYADVLFNPNINLTGVPVHLSFLSLEDFEQGFDIGCCNYNLSNPRLIVGAENAQDEAFFDSYSTLGGGRVELQQPTVLSRAFYTTSRITPTSGFMLLFNDSTTPTTGARNIVDITSSAAKPNFNIFLGAINNGGNVYNANSANRKFGFFSVGDGLTSGECVNLYSAVKKLQFDMSRNLSPFFNLLEDVEYTVNNLISTL